MSKEKGISGVPPTRLDQIAFALYRPWVMALAVGFILIPSHWLVAGLNSGAAFLKLGSGARPAAMGGAYTAVAEDVDAMYYNPGGLANLKKSELGATHAQWLLDTQFDFVGYAQPTQFGTLGMAVTRLAVGGQEGRDANRQATTSFEAADTAYTLSYSRGLGAIFGAGRTSLGGNLKFLQSKIGAYSAQSQAVDLGAQHHFDGSPMSLGLSVLNLGPGMRFLDQVDPLPTTIAAGAAYRLGGVLRVAFDVRREIHDQRTEIGIGTEYALLPTLNLRAGYASQFTPAAAAGGGGAINALGGLGAGFGINIRNFRADYTFTPFGELGNVQRLSLGARFGEAK